MARHNRATNSAAGPKFGVVLPQHNAGREELFAAAAMAEERGLDSVWLSEVLTGRRDPKRPVLEGWSALAAVAASTTRLVCGSLVLRIGLRPPLLVAKMFSSLELVAPGRVIAGLGVGDSMGRPEQMAYGISFRKRKERLGLLEETIGAIRTHAKGVPIWLGGYSQEILELLPDVNGWNLWGTVSQFTEKSKLVLGSEQFTKSWAGSYRGNDAFEQLIGAGADHLIVAVGAANFKERIDQICSVRDRLGSAY